MTYLAVLASLLDRAVYLHPPRLLQLRLHRRRHRRRRRGQDPGKRRRRGKQHRARRERPRRQRQRAENGRHCELPVDCVVRGESRR